VVLPTDYETVSIFSRRMYEVMRRYSPTVEEYSIDEGFVDLTGTRRVHRGSYGAIAEKLKADIERELGITVTVGLSVSKVLAKVATDLGKPAGLVAVSARDVRQVLNNYPIGKVWTIGPNTAALLRHYGLNTAGQFAGAKRARIEEILTRPGVATWRELNGESVWPVATDRKVGYQSISKTRTFTPPSRDKEYVYAQLVKNVENACIKARRYEQAAGKISLFIKRQDHRALGVEASLIRPSCYPVEFLPAVRTMFEQVFVEGIEYRATGFILRDLGMSSPSQTSLFETRNKVKKIRRLYGAVDLIAKKYGKHGVHQGASLAAQKNQHLTNRGDVPGRRRVHQKGESWRRRLPVPLLQIKS